MQSCFQYLKILLSVPSCCCCLVFTPMVQEPQAVPPAASPGCASWSDDEHLLCSLLSWLQAVSWLCASCLHAPQSTTTTGFVPLWCAEEKAPRSRAQPLSDWKPFVTSPCQKRFELQLKSSEVSTPRIPCLQAAPRSDCSRSQEAPCNFQPRLICDLHKHFFLCQHCAVGETFPCLMLSWDARGTGADTAAKENELQSTEGFSFVFSVRSLTDLRPSLLVQSSAAVKLSQEQSSFKQGCHTALVF